MNTLGPSFGVTLGARQSLGLKPTGSFGFQRPAPRNTELIAESSMNAPPTTPPESTGTAPPTAPPTAAADLPTLLQRVAAGDRDAFAECVERYRNLIWSLAAKRCPDRHTAEDAVQEIFVEIWKSAGRFDPQRATETTFIAMIARRRLIDQLRKQSRRPRLESLGARDDESGVNAANAMGSTDDLQRIDDQEQADRVRTCVNDLGEPASTCLRLSIVDSLSHAEIAGKLGLPLGTVKTNIRRGLIRVREKMSVASAPTMMGGA